MEQKQINQLMISMGKYGMKKLSLKKDGFEISLEREGVTEFYAYPQQKGHPQVDIEGHVESSTFKVDQNKDKSSSLCNEEKSLFVHSSMVGTFYRAASPTDVPYVKLGDKVIEDTVVGLVEAMKVMNEVKAGVRGTVDEVLVENGYPVEFSTKLFKITPTM